MTMSLGAILSIIDGNKKAQAINSVSNNLNFAVDSMVRDIKTGYGYSCTGGTPDQLTKTSDIGSDKNGCDVTVPVQEIDLISTITGDKRGVSYLKLTDSSGVNRIYKRTSDNSNSLYPVTSAEVDITTLNFYIDNPVTSTYSGQPKVFLVIKGTAKVNPTQTSDFAIQTLISQRNLNLPK